MTGKSIYRLMLDDDIINAVDRLAERSGLSRSAMIEKLISDQISYTSPYSRINEIFDGMSRIMDGFAGFTVYETPDKKAFQLKSSLARYRPSVKYEIKIYDRMSGYDFGEMKATVRTDDPSSLSSAEDFFRAFCRLERLYLEYDRTDDINRSLDMNRGVFTRGLRLTGSKDHTSREISQKITDYVSMIDTMMKRWFERGYTSPEDMENDYLSYLSAGVGLI